MKLIRFGSPGDEKPGVILPDATRIDASAFVSDFDDEFFENNGIARLEDWTRRNAVSAPRVPQGMALGRPVARPRKIVCIGLNYRDHATETANPIPPEPVLFFKATTSLVGPNDPVVI